MGTTIVLNVLFAMMFVGAWASAVWLTYRALGRHSPIPAGRSNSPEIDSRSDGREERAAA
jgi:hypothetical protein